MTILFPDHPARRALPDPDYAAEFEAAHAAGLRTAVFSLEALRSGDDEEAFSRTRSAELPGEPLVYRGWMMSDRLYQRLWSALVTQGYRLVNDSARYAEAHYLPQAYRHLALETAESVWCEGRDEDDAWQA